jgi:dihydroxyacid dehydratase/phosphogluconate dehydratase
MIYISPWLTDAVDAGTWIIGADSDRVRNGTLYNSSTADQDAVSYKVYMLAGTYTCKFLGTTNTNQSILKIKIDGSTVVTEDMYDSVLTRNVVKTTTGIVVTAEGVKTIQVIADGKNASSSDFIVNLQEIVFYRTA